MKLQAKIVDGVQSVTIDGNFTYENKQDFFVVVRNLAIFTDADAIQKTVVDLSGVEFLDSAGLGMLLLFNEEAQMRDSKVVLKNPRGQVEKLFKLSMLEKVMTIEK